nr:hypothetical protein [Tanacetum cinerariifolium]
MVLSFAKLEKFKGVDFRRWQKKMQFMLFSMSVVYVLTTPMPDDGGENPTVEQARKRVKWDNNDYVCIGLILNDFKHTLKHLKEELTLIELGSHLRIKESLRVQHIDKPKGKNVSGPSVVNMVEHNNSSRYNDNKDKRKHHDTRANLNKKPNVLLHSKDEALDKFKVFKTEVELQQESLIKRFRTDRGACYLLNRFPNKRNKITPYELWSKKKPNLNYLRVWGCRAAIRLPDPKLKTLGKRGIECIFVGYAKHSKAFRFYVIEPNDSVAINSIIELMDAIFDEYMFSSVPRPSQRSLVKGTEDSGEAINDGMDSIMGNNTWVLTDLPPGCRPLDCKWIFKRKPKVDGTIEKFKASFLEWGLEEEVYMNQPLGFIMPGNKNKMCKLIKSLYGLKQVPKQWHQKFDEVVLSNSYLLNQADKCVYSKFDLSGIFIIKVLYKNMGEADVILGIRIKHESNGIAISQSHYIEKVLKKFNYSDCTPVGTPLDTCEKLMPNKGLAVSQLEYSRVIGCLMYAMTCTKPDIAFAVGKLSRLVYPGYPLVLEGFTDANWISNTEDSSSTSGSMAGTATLAKAYSQMYNGKSRHLGVRHSMIRELITNAVVSIEFRAESHVLQNIPRMCLEPAGKEDEVANFSMVNFFEKVLSRSMNKEEPPMEDCWKFSLIVGICSYRYVGMEVQSVHPEIIDYLHPDLGHTTTNTVDQVGILCVYQKGSKQMVCVKRMPLMVVSMYESLNVLKKIISLSRADVNHLTSIDQTTALHCATSSKSSYAVDAVKFLLAKGADPRLMDANGVRPVDMMVDSPKFHELLETKDGVSCVILNFKSNREYRVNPSLPDIIKSIYSTDEFMTYSYKVRSCPQAYSHDWTKFLFAHPDEYLNR